MLQDAVCAVMQGMVTEDVTMCHWMLANVVGCSDALHDGSWCYQSVVGCPKML